MRRWFLSYNSADAEKAEQLEAGLKAKDPQAEVFFAPKNLRAGGYWQPALADEIAEATAFILLVGEKGLGPWQVIEYYEAFDKRVKCPQFPLVLVLLEGQPAPGLAFIRQLHWIVTADPASEQALAQLADAAAGAGTRPAELWRHTSPYRGLAAMTEADSDFFFGRQAKTVEVLEALANDSHRLPVLLGNSGVGKSSLAQAGVLAALKRRAWPQGADAARKWPHALRDSRHWSFLTLKPGAEPLKALVTPFLDSWQYGATDPERVKLQNGWIELLRGGKASLRDLIDATERRYGELGQLKPPAFFVYVDQGEELYVRAQAGEREQFSQLIAHGVGDPRLFAVMSMRSDFLGALQNDERLYAVHAKIDVPPLRESELRRVISEPAKLLSARFESEGLIEVITARTAEDSARDAGALPLLSYTLDDMWTQMVKRGDGVLRLPTEAFEPGGVLADRANAFLASHPGSEDILRRVLTLKLASVRENGDPTRRAAPRSEFSEAEWRLVSELADYPHRLLVTATPEGGETYAEIAHEAIFRRWNRLREWLTTEREFLIWKSELESARRRWQQAPDNARNDALLMGLALAQAQSWVTTRAEDLSRADREFIAGSLRREAEERRQREALRRYVLVTAVAALAAVSVLAFFLWRQWSEAESQRAAAVQQEQMLSQEREHSKQVVALVLSGLASISQGGNRAEEVLNQAIMRDPTDVTSYFLRALISTQNRDYDRVIADLTRVIELEPDYAFAYVSRGSAYQSTNDYDRALADYDRAVMLEPNNAINYNTRGFARYKQKDYDRAVEDYDKAITLDPKYAVAYNGRGNVYWAKPDLDRAIADYDQAIALEPSTANAYFWYGNRCGVYYDKQDYDHALADCDRALRLNPGYVWAYNRRGNVHWAKHDYDRALADYNEAIIIDPNNTEAYAWYGNKCGVYYDKREYDRAIADCDQALKLNPKYGWAYNRRGNIYWAKHEYDRALDDYNQAITSEPDNPEAYAWYGNRCGIYYYKQDYDQAIANCDEAIKLNTKYDWAYSYRALAYLGKQDYDHAIKDYDTAITLNPSYATYYASRGAAYRTRGDLDRALSDFEQAIALDPKYAEAYNDRGVVYWTKHEYVSAISDFGQAIALKPQNPLYYTNRGTAYRSKGDFDRALDDFNKAIQIDSSFALAFVQRGLTFFTTNNYERAIADYNQALSLDPKLALALLGRALAKFKLGDATGANADMAAAKAIQPDILEVLKRFGLGATP